MRSIEEALADCLERLEAGELTPDEALRLYPGLRSELGPLLGLAAELRAMPKVEAPASLRTYKRPAFRPVPAPEAWWRKLLPVGGTQLGRSGSLARAAAALAVLFMASGGTIVASANSLPDEPLYPVKLAVESAQLAMAPNDHARADLELQFAAKRLREIERAAEQGRTDAVTKGVDLYSQQMDAALEAAGATTGQGGSEVEESLRQNQAALDSVLQKVENPKAREAIEHAMTVSSQPPGQIEEKAGKETGALENRDGKTDKSDKPAPDVVAPGRDKATGTPTVLPSPTAETARPSEGAKTPNDSSDKPKGNSGQPGGSGQPDVSGPPSNPGQSSNPGSAGNPGQERSGNQEPKGQVPKQAPAIQSAPDSVAPALSPTATAPPSATPVPSAALSPTSVQSNRGGSAVSKSDGAQNPKATPPASDLSDSSVPKKSND